MSGRNPLKLEAVGKIPPMEFEQAPDGEIRFRYVVELEDDYPGFDNRWRVLHTCDQRKHLRMGGEVADWLRSLSEGKSK